jgi:hypothetical protein
MLYAPIIVVAVLWAIVNMPTWVLLYRAAEAAVREGLRRAGVTRQIASG